MAILLLMIIGVSPLIATAQLVDELDSYPPRWQLAGDDCNARVLSRSNQPNGGFDGGPHERISVRVGDGSTVPLVYPVQPLRPLDDLNATVYFRAGFAGATIGFRLRYPYVTDPLTSRSVSIVLPGAAYRQTGDWQRIGIGRIERQVAQATITVRKRFGSDADVRDPMVDAVVVDIFNGPGQYAVSLDQLNVDGMIPIETKMRTGGQRDQTLADLVNRVPVDAVAANPAAGSAAAFDLAPFPASRISRLIQYNGEPLLWLKSLGFDGIWIDGPCTAAVLSEAGRQNMTIYCQPPSTIDPTLTPLMEPVAAWMLSPPAGDDGGGVLDSRYLDSIAAAAERLRRLPSRYRRPIIAAPLEDHARYAQHLDGLIDWLPPRTRRLTIRDSLADHLPIAALPRDRMSYAIGIDTLPPAPVQHQVKLIANSLGSDPPNYLPWQSMWVQTFAHLAHHPSAIFFRSRSALSQSDAVTSSRATSLSYINRMIAMVEPWLGSIEGGDPNDSAMNVGVSASGSIEYRGRRIDVPGAQWYLLTTNQSDGPQVIAGDGGEITLPIAPDGASLVYRMTEFVAQPLRVEQNATGRQVKIVSPDAIEIIVVTADAALGGRLTASANRFSSQAATDRFSLANVALQTTILDRQIAIAGGFIPAGPDTLIDAAQQTLRMAAPALNAGDDLSALHSAARADAWAMRCRWNLAKALRRPDSPHQSWPALDCGALEIQAAWRSTLPRDLPNGRGADNTIAGPFSTPGIRYGKNLLTTGSLDEPRLLGPGRWSFGKRLEQRVESEVLHVTRDAFAGGGAIRAAAWPKRINNSVSATPVSVVSRLSSERSNPGSQQSSDSGAAGLSAGLTSGFSAGLGGENGSLGGGYAGTVIHVESPSIRFAAGESLQITAMVKTIGFSGPHQGLLVYETSAGPESGILISGGSPWTEVELYRQTSRDEQIAVQFEWIGYGEAVIDEVQIRRAER